MAAALVGGSFLSAFLQVLFDRMASRDFVDFFNAHNLNDRLLKKLKSTMRSVNKVLNDAEEKQITDSAVKDWLDELKDVVYEADDLLDEIAYEALRSKLEADSQRSSLHQVKNSLSALIPFNKGVEAKLETILECLDDLIQQKEDLGLKEGIGDKPSSWKIPTTSLVDESLIYGRGDDRESIMKLLLSDGANGKRIDVIPVVGVVGVGKTTLAQLVYNDNRVKERFNLKAWVYVSQEFDVLKVTKDILKNIGLLKCDMMTENQLHCELEEKLKGNKVLLVLDDVWSDNQGQWDFLLTPFKSVTHGSKIVVTTRNESVASIKSTVPTHHLQELSEDDCWLLFAKYAFDDESSSVHGELEEIGREIAKKCEGLPLAAKTLGGLLCSKKEAYEWKKVLKSNIWGMSNDEILPALRLSYHYLPSHLKRRFAYCALFPKGYKFEKKILVLLWMAEGFIVQQKGNEEMEEVGEGYFSDLVSRSFFQQSRVNPSYFIMHDLINDLAKFVSGEFCFRLTGESLCKFPKKIRHLSDMRIEYDAFKNFEGIYEFQFLRTFFNVKWSRWEHVLSTHSCLRVLSLSWHSNIGGLPDSIGNLKHLRYLDLSATSIRGLPEIVSTLYYLQTLILYKCQDLVELPTNLAKLVNLRHLDITETKLQKMPSQMGKLAELQLLTDFFLGKQSGSSIKELGTLKHLRGNLRIWNLQNVVDARCALEANLKSKMHLKKLELRWNGDTNDSLHERDILGQLQPHTNVESLNMVGYGGTRFPEWVGDSSFSNIVSLKLSNCTHCSFLGPFGQLASLKRLSIIGFDAVLTVGLEFFGSCTSLKKPFASLEILRFEGMQEWHEWISDVEGAFPVLRELYIIECPNLTKALPNHLPSLTKLVILVCDQLMASLPKAPTILKMTLRDKSRFLELTKLCSGLQNLYVHWFYSLDSPLQVIEKMGVVSTTLEAVRIADCHLRSLCALEGSLGDFTSLRSLDIWYCPNFVLFPRGKLSASNLIQL